MIAIAIVLFGWWLACVLDDPVLSGEKTIERSEWA